MHINERAITCCYVKVYTHINMKLIGFLYISFSAHANLWTRHFTDSYVHTLNIIKHQNLYVSRSKKQSQDVKLCQLTNIKITYNEKQYAVFYRESWKNGSRYDNQGTRESSMYTCTRTHTWIGWSTKNTKVLVKTPFE